MEKLLMASNKEKEKLFMIMESFIKGYLKLTKEKVMLN
jgi:hypothetical protein